jgi:ABC-2 type transport system ATP-binding protein
VPQGFAFYQALTVAEHIDYAQSWRRRFDRKFVEARLRDLRIPLSQRATTLSGGQQAQLSLAIALGSRASVLILDEPLAALDPLARREFMQNLRDVVRAEGRTALLSSHVVADVQHVCERIIILSEATIRLDLQVSEALATHRLISEANDDSRVAGKAIAQIPSFAGAPVTLVLGRPSTVHEQPSLEEIVMGYLAASRTTAELPKHIRAGS